MAMDRSAAIRTTALALMLGLTGCGRPAPAPPTRAAAPPTPTPAALPTPEAPEKTTPVVAEVEPSPPTIEPASATLGPDDPGIQFVVTGGEDGGDLTRLVSWTAEPAGVLAIEPGGYARAIGAGAATVTATVEGGDAVAAEVVVEGSAERPWDFGTDIVPIFTVAGCNTGGCHGKAEGRNGFHLSLFGYDPDGDHRALTREAGGRRLSRIEPDESLLLRKATGRVPHGGGRVLAIDSDEYETIRAWIADGAPRSRGEVHGALVAVEVRPGAVRLEGPGPRQLRVVARYADGHERDVTRLARYAVHDETAATVDPKGRAELLRRAETDLIVRYQTEVVPARLATVINPGLDFDFTKVDRHNFIDEHLIERLASLRVPPSRPADDATFLRRATLDLIGQLPRPDQIRAFLDDDDPEKRSKLIDRLMDDPLYVPFWQIKLGDLLQISTARFGNGRGQYDAWVEEQLAANRPWDEFVRTLLTSTGDPMDPVSGGPINYAIEGQDAKEQAELTAQRFLGLRFRCAQCHDHPFDVWTQDDYYGLAAFFAKVGRPAPGNMSMYGNEVTVNPDGFVTHLRTGEKAEPRLPGGESVELPPDADPRVALADWMTGPENPYFARAAANWAWAQFFGRGLAEPADDLGAANPPVHPEVLDALAADFVAHEYDLRHLIRTVATSAAYGWSSAAVPGNEGDTRLFSHQSARPLTAHQMADALAQATDTELLFDLSRGSMGRPVAEKAVKIADPTIPSVLLDTFGRCPRTSGCEPVATPTLSLRQSLMLIGGDVIDERIARFDGYLANLLEFDPTPAEVVENLYLRTLCRRPSAAETAHWEAALAEAPTLREASEDLFWALLNSREFAFNH